MLFAKFVPWRARRSYVYDSIAAVLVGLYSGAIFPFLGRIARGDLHASAFEISLMSAAPFIGNLFSPVWARQMEGRAKVPFVVWSGLGSRALFLLMPLAVNPALFVSIAFGSMIIGTIAAPAYASVMKDIYPDDCRGRVMGYIRIGAQAASLSAALCVGRLLDVVSYRIVFPIGAAAGIAGAIAFSRIRASDGEASDVRFGVFDTLRIFRDDPNYRWFALSVFTTGFANLLASPVYTIFQVDELHISNTQVANLSNLTSLVSIAFYFFWGRYLDRHGPLRTVLLNVIFGAMVPIIYIRANSVYDLIPAAVCQGISWAGIELSYINSILFFADQRRVAQYQALHSALLGVRGTIAPFTGAFLLNQIGIKPTFAVAFCISVAGVLMQTLGVRKKYELAS
ncbi:MAG: MFS transporter [Armatimonadota bacterium]